MSHTDHTIVIVPGAWSDGNSWRAPLVALAKAGYDVRAAQLPLTSFEDDVRTLSRLLDRIETSVTLVGHSYAGAVITAVGTSHKVRSLAYVCAVAPDSGEKLADLFGRHPTKATTQPSADAAGFLWLDEAFVADALAHDLDAAAVRLVVAAQKPINGAFYNATVDAVGWKNKPTAYLVTTEDRILSPETQREMATRIHAHVEEIDASHLVHLSRPDAVARFVRAHVESLTK